MTVTAVGNRKGGVGKSTITVLLAGALARKGRKVLLIDMDEQRSASLTVGGSGEKDMLDVLDRKNPAAIAEAIVPSNWEGVDVIPGSSDITYLDNESDGMVAFRLRRAMANESELIATYDDVLIDTPPSLGACTVTGLLAADRVLAVAQPEKFSNMGLDEFIDALVNIRSDARPDLRFHGVIVNGMDKRLNEHRNRVAELQNALGAEAILEPTIPHRAAIMSAISTNTPLHLLRRDDAGDIAELFAAHADLLIANEGKG